MASTLLRVLEKVNNGRLECIKNAKAAGFTIGDNAPLSEVAACLAESQGPFYAPSLDSSVLTSLRSASIPRGSNLPDTKPIFEEAQPKEINGVMLYPIYVLTFAAGATTIDTYYTCYGTGTSTYLITSDGDELPTATSGVNYTFSGANPYNYVIVYAPEAYYNGTTAVQKTSTNNSKIELEAYLGVGYYTSWYGVGTWANNAIQIIRASEKTNIRCTGNFVKSGYLKYVEVLGDAYCSNTSNSGNYFFSSAASAASSNKLIIPKLATCYGYAFSSAYANKETVVDLSGLVNCTEQLPYDPLCMYLPNLVSWNMAESQTIGSPFIYAPQWVTGNGSFNLTLNNTESFVYGNNLQLGSVTLNNPKKVFRFEKPISISALTVTGYVYHLDLSYVTFRSGMNNLNMPAVENCVFPSMQSTDINAAKWACLSHESLIGLLEKLPGCKTNPLKLTLSDYQKSILSDEELSIATNKGWVIV